MVSPRGSFLTFTSYVPASMLGTLKLMEVSVAEAGVTLVTLLVFLLVRITFGDPPELRFVPTK